jgi:hypothetical protein
MDRILFNYPFVGSSSIRENQRLLLNFLISASPYLSEKGEIHVRLCNTQSEDWKLKELLEGTHLEVKSVELFDENDFPGYHRKREDQDTDWYIFPNTARTWVLTHRVFGYEALIRKVMLQRWSDLNSVPPVLSLNKKRKRSTETQPVEEVPKQQHFHIYLQPLPVCWPTLPSQAEPTEQTEQNKVTSSTPAEESPHPLNPYTDFVRNLYY